MPCRIAALIASLAICAGCTTIGAHTSERDAVDYGPPQTLEVCLLKHPDVTQQRADELTAAVNAEFVTYGITVSVPWVREWQRPGFTASGIMEDLNARNLEEPCDRLVGLVDRHVGDFLWGLVMPEVLGAVDGITHTRGFVVANWGSINQLFSEPLAAVVHEFYHFLGCGHGFAKTKCYHRIAALKASRAPGSDFMPGITKDGKYLHSVNEANEAMRRYLAEEKAKQ